MRSIPIVALILAVLALTPAAHSAVTVSTGPTPIPRGNATGERDITIQNGLFAIAFAVDTAPPWGAARGGILDIAIVRDGEAGYDIASLADFTPNRWASWPTTYQRVSVEKATPQEAIVRTARDWGDVELVSTFRILDGDSRIQIVTTMTNKGEAPLEGLFTGYVVWPDGGSLIGAPGIDSAVLGIEENALPAWSASYDEQWALGLHAPFATYVSFGGRDRYLRHDLPPGAMRSFEAWLQIESGGSLAPMVQTEIDLRRLPSGRLYGQVLSENGEPVRTPVVVVGKRGTTYAWTVGEDGAYDIVLPAGRYDIAATARGFAPGTAQTVTVSANGETELDFDDVRPPGTIRLQVTDERTGRGLDARISIREGHKPLVGYFGKTTFFTGLDAVGRMTESIAPGRYVLDISAGGGFTSVPQAVEVDIEPGRVHELAVEIPVLAAPQEHGWYSADLHHHSDVLDGFSEPEYVLRSELAAGIDIAFLSDHDSVVNNAPMQILARARGRLFIAGTELSPSWGHFNAYPLDDGKSVDIDSGRATVQEIFAAARRMGAAVIEVNHPYSEYGYFESLENGPVPGGYDAGFDLVEIERSFFDARNKQTLERVWRLWNEGRRVYLAAGSDVHDVWLQESGSVRTYVRVDGELTIDRFVESLKAGRAYASQGPLVFPEIAFGSDIVHETGRTLYLNYTVQAVSGLKSVQLIERGRDILTAAYHGNAGPLEIFFTASPEADTWFALVIEDMNGKFAYTNPVWVSVD